MAHEVEQRGPGNDPEDFTVVVNDAPKPAKTKKSKK